MINWEEVENFLREQKIFEMDVLLLREFVGSLPFDDRQAVMQSFLAYPEKLNFMIDILKKKRSLASDYNNELADEIIAMEMKELEATK